MDKMVLVLVGVNESSEKADRGAAPRAPSEQPPLQGCDIPNPHCNYAAVCMQCSLLVGRLVA
jgi:hypothetical protein